MSKLETIEGIGPAISDKLSEAGVGSVAALLKMVPANRAYNRLQSRPESPK